MAAMELDGEEGLLQKLAADGQMAFADWPKLSEYILSRIDHIARNDFPIPKLRPPPPPPARSTVTAPRGSSPLPSSPLERHHPSAESSQEANKENHPSQPVATAPEAPSSPSPLPPTPPPGSLPTQIEAMLDENLKALSEFRTHPPHTIQRLAELVLAPRRHYRGLASWLYAVDRVVHVTSGNDTYPLPPAVPDMSTMTLTNGVGAGPNGKSAAEGVAWSNPAVTAVTPSSAGAAASTLGTDEALGGALLSPIPWLTRPPRVVEEMEGAMAGTMTPAAAAAAAAAQNQAQAGSSSSRPSSASSGRSVAEIRAENTETIDGPNGVGTIETVSVSINGIHSAGAAAAGGSNRPGITQGELLREEQRAGVVPVSQLNRAALTVTASAAAGDDDEDLDDLDDDEGEAEMEVPHARGPDEIGAEDVGPQPEGLSGTFAAGAGVEMHGIDIEAAVGRKLESGDVVAVAPATVPTETQVGKENKALEEDEREEQQDETPEQRAADVVSEAGSKRDADEELDDGLASKRLKKTPEPEPEPEPGTEGERIKGEETVGGEAAQEAEKAA